MYFVRSVKVIKILPFIIFFSQINIVLVIK